MWIRHCIYYWIVILVNFHDLKNNIQSCRYVMIRDLSLTSLQVSKPVWKGTGGIHEDQSQIGMRCSNYLIQTALNVTICSLSSFFWRLYWSVTAVSDVKNILDPRIMTASDIALSISCNCLLYFVYILWKKHEMYLQM